MTCEEAKTLWIQSLEGILKEEDRARLQAHLAGCPGCAAEIRDMDRTWKALGALPLERPSERVRENFQALFEKQTGPGGFWRRLAHFGPAPLAAAAAGLLLIGLASGVFLDRIVFSGRMEISRLRREVESMNQTTAVSLIRQASASERLRGVNLAAAAADPRPGLLAVLLETLDSDPSVNVRLAAADALFLFTDRPEVREGILKSLPAQTSPIVQTALLDVLSGIREARAARALRTLIADDKLNPDVRRKAERVLSEIAF